METGPNVLPGLAIIEQSLLAYRVCSASMDNSRPKERKGTQTQDYVGCFFGQLALSSISTYDVKP
jgi:hypothetical protein